MIKSLRIAVAFGIFAALASNPLPLGAQENGSVLTDSVTVGVGTISVENSSPFFARGGNGIIGSDRFAYTGISGNDLTGVTWINSLATNYDIGEYVRAIPLTFFMREITVTAQKREENVQDIPLSVTAITGDRLVDGGILDITSLKILTPGLNFGQTGANAHLAIRGARTEGILQNVQPVISFYNDNIYRSGTLQAFSPLVDIDRVEILRGPQGTLFGRNAYGGAVNFISNRPRPGFDAGITGTVGDYTRTDLEGFFNYGFSDNVMGRVAVAHRQHDGYVTNLFDRSEDIKDQDEDFLRAQLLFRDPTERFSLLVRGEYWKQGGNGSADFNYFTPGTPAGGSVFGEVLPDNVLGGGRIDTDPYEFSRDVDFVLDAEQKTFSAELAGDLGFANVKILASWTDYTNLHTNDIDMGPATTGFEGQFDDIDTKQLEIHFTDNGQGPLQWLFGAFFLQEKSRDSFFFDYVYEFPVGVFNSGFFANRRDMETDANAVFAQATLPLMDDRLRLTAGLRFSDEKQNFRVRSRCCTDPIDRGTGAIPLSPDNLLTPADFLGATFNGPLDFNFAEGFTGGDALFEDFENTAEFNPVTWRGAVDYDVTDNSMLYVAVSTGYSAGGFNSVANPLTGEFTFPEQEVTAYEVGSKNILSDGAMLLNVAVFYNDFHQILSEPAVDIGATIIYNDIGGDGTALGVDVEFDWYPSAEAFVNVRISVLNAEFGSFETGTGSGLTEGNTTRTATDGTVIPFVDVSGLQIPFSPDFTFGVSAGYSFQLGGTGSITPAVDFYYSGEYFTADQHYPFSLQEAYTQTALRLTWRSSSQTNLSIQAFVHNLENEAVILRTNIFTQRQIGQTFGDPRTLGVRLSWHY